MDIQHVLALIGVLSGAPADEFAALKAGGIDQGRRLRRSFARVPCGQ